MRQKLETETEQDHAQRARRAGWFVEKIMKTGRGGFPDRFYAKAGRVVLIEWKRPNGVVSKQQFIRHAELRNAGVEVHVVRSLADADRILHMENGGRANKNPSTDAL